MATPEARNRKPKSSKLDAPTRRVSAESWGDHDPSPNGFWSAFVWAPFDRYTARKGIVLLGYIMELLGTFLFCLFVNLARQNLPVTATPGVLLGSSVESLVLGIVGGLSYYTFTGFRLQFDEQPRHLSWTVTFASIFTFRTGFIPGFVYMCAQTGGAALAGVTLWGLSVNIVPGGSASPLATALGYEILGTFVIVFPLLYNTLLGVPLEEEAKNLRNGQAMASAGRTLATTVLIAGNSYSFDAVIYIAGLIGFGLLADVNNPYASSPAFYILLPYAGALASLLLYYILLGLFKMSSPTKIRRGLGSDDAPIQRHLETPLAQQTKMEDIVTFPPNRRR